MPLSCFSATVRLLYDLAGQDLPCVYRQRQGFQGRNKKKSQAAVDSFQRSMFKI